MQNCPDSFRLQSDICQTSDQSLKIYLQSFHKIKKINTQQFSYIFRLQSDSFQTYEQHVWTYVCNHCAKSKQSPCNNAYICSDFSQTFFRLMIKVWTYNFRLSSDLFQTSDKSLKLCWLSAAICCTLNSGLWPDSGQTLVRHLITVR